MIVGLCSSYAEGTLIQHAIRSALEGCDQVVCFEGPAGDPIEGVPETDLGMWAGAAGLRFHRGEWKTDAAKRTAMVKHCQGRWPTGAIWGVWVDGDEILMNGEYLRDYIQQVTWLDKHDPQDTPRAGFPIPLVELDGRVITCRAKVIRIDLIDHYLVSSSGIVFKNGVTMAEGNLPVDAEAWYQDREKEIVEDHAVFLPPPLPFEPYLAHRSALRHPLRAGLRMHEQEADELRRLGVA